MNDFKNIIDKENDTRAVLVSVLFDGANAADNETSLDELERLLDTAGGEAYARLTQSKSAPDPRTYIGSGKVDELKTLCQAHEIPLVVFDNELTPSQIKNLEDELNEGAENEKDAMRVRVIDRSMLILDIFALHAVTSEGKLQVELAQLKYTAPRLTGHGIDMSRQQGGNIAMRGPGETKLETDRRHLKRRIESLEKDIGELERKRAVQRRQRDRSGLFKIAIAGYTNAGKSTLLNSLTDAGILTEDKLFATLDPTTRKYTLPGGTQVLLTDTVGFIRNLPHHLIKAFKSTLDEVSCADAVVIVIDSSDPERESQLEVTETLINELGAAEKPKLYVYNKCDVDGVPWGIGQDSGRVWISALNGFGIDLLAEQLEIIALAGKTTEQFLIPVSESSAVNELYSFASVKDIEYGNEFIAVTAEVDSKVKGRLAKYLNEPV